MSLSRYTPGDEPAIRLSPEDARTLRKLADAAAEQGVNAPALVAARAAPLIQIEDAAVATIAAAEAMETRPPAWARRQVRGGESA